MPDRRHQVEAPFRPLRIFWEAIGMLFKKLLAAIGIAGMSISSTVAPALAACAPKAANPCNPCAAQNPCAAANPCNPCAAKNPCAAANPCAAKKNPCNPCAAN